MSCFTILFCLLLPYMIQSVPLASRTVYDPPITSPNAQTVWTVGETTIVTWDVSSLPANSTNMGMLVLGYEANNSENLMLDSPLATGFLLTDAHIQITVPDVPPRTTYIVVLFGDSGNTSPEFTIAGPSSVSPTGSAPAYTSDASVATSASSPSTSLPPVQFTATTPSSFSPSPTSLGGTTSATSPLTAAATSTQSSDHASSAALKTRQLNHQKKSLVGLMAIMTLLVVF